LSDDLQGIGNCHRQNARIHQRTGTACDALPSGCFRKHHNDGGQNGAEKGVDTVQPQAVYSVYEVVYGKNLHRKHQCAAKQQQIADSNRRYTYTAETVQAGNTQQNTEWNSFGGFLTPKDAQNRHEDNIHCG